MFKVWIGLPRKRTNSQILVTIKLLDGLDQIVMSHTAEIVFVTTLVLNDSLTELARCDHFPGYLRADPSPLDFGCTFPLDSFRVDHSFLWI